MPSDSIAGSFSADGTDTAAAVRVPVLPAPSVVRCAFMIAAIKAALKALGFGGTIGWIRRRVESIPASAHYDVGSVKAAEHAVAMAGALYPGRARCLEQSLTLYYFLRRRGVAIKYCHGVQPHPFVAHAWLEYQGVPINDVTEHIKWFARLPDELP